MGESIWDVIKKRVSRSTWPFPVRLRTSWMANMPRLWSEWLHMRLGRGEHAFNTRGYSYYQEHNVLYGPGKACQRGRRRHSGLEMTQNSMRLSWTREEVDKRLLVIMKSIHQSCLDAAEIYGKKGDYVTGANIAGFLKVAKSMLAYGIV